MMNSRPKILIASMNWGLGHASRDIPVIQEVLQAGAEVIIAASGRPLQLLRKEFPELASMELKGYDIRYHRKRSIASQMFFQLPEIITSFFNEHRQLKKIIKEEKIDAVISDNRFGLFSKDAYCVFITHQVSIRLPKNIRLLGKIINRVNINLIEKFDECWVPDWEGSENLSGSLSHPKQRPRNTKYIGPLSRFHNNESRKEFDVLFLLSGPEPQRTVFEELLKEEIKKIPDNNYKMLMVRGITEGDDSIRFEHDKFFVTDFLRTTELNRSILSSEIIISRPGYSTIMDLAALGKKAIFVPTPGQPEQEYLAAYFKSKKMSYSSAQKGFDLLKSLEAAANYDGFPISDTSTLSIAIKNLMERLRKRNTLTPRSIPALGELPR